MRTIPVLLLIAIISFYACQPTSDKGHHHNLYESVFNPPAEGFNLEASDSIAIALADSVMQASGGRKAWDDTHYVSWNFFGFRTLLWDQIHQLGAPRLPFRQPSGAGTNRLAGWQSDERW